jgi:hypothetical protein
MLGISKAEVAMAETSKSKTEKIKHPQNYYETPDALTKDPDLSSEEKKKALDVWEQDARQMLTASNEGMAGSEEGVSKSDHSQLGQVERAKNKLRDKPKRNAPRGSS